MQLVLQSHALLDICRHAIGHQAATQHNVMIDSGSTLPRNYMPASDDSTSPRRKTVEATGNPPKWPDWGIYNYKAVVAYDGTTYKYVPFVKHNKLSYTCLMDIQCFGAVFQRICGWPCCF